jgi:hypothetical protein
MYKRLRVGILVTATILGRGRANDDDLGITREPTISLEWHRIDLNRPCYFFTQHGSIWSVTFDDGSGLSVVCTFPLPFRGPQLRFVYTSPQRRSFIVGRCIFYAGCNEARYCTAQRRGGPAILLETEWRTVDGAKNDGQRPIERSVQTGPEEPYLDAVTWTFHPATRRLRWVNEKYEYKVDPKRLETLAPTCEELAKCVGPRVEQLTRSGETVFP